MKLSVRLKIFLPIAVLLIAFPAATWLAFRYTLDSHMNYSASQDLEQVIRETGKLIEEWEDEPEADGAAAGSEDGRNPEGPGESLLGRLRIALQTEAGETRMLVMNEKFRVLYPDNYDDQPELAELYAMALSELTGQDSSWQAETIVEETVGDSLYMLYYRPVELAGQEIRHVILYCPIHDTSTILNQVSRLLLMIMAAMTGVSIVFSWFVAGGISGPVRRLSAAARGIGEKKFRRVETGATVKELCELEDEINDMQEKLAQADQAERTFFQNASHELRTPLMSISGYAQGIQRGVFTDTAQAAGVILEESNRLTEVVDGILTLTRMDQLRYQVVPVSLPLREFIGERFERLEGLAYSKKIRLVLKPGEEHTLILDAQLLERAFTNVVSNCIRYAASEVQIGLEEEEGWLLLTVSDDGPGLKPEELGHLFDRFYKGKDGNHGLGLAIAKSSLEYMGGEISAVSSPDGAVFILRLPQDCRTFAVDG